MGFVLLHLLDGALLLRHIFNGGKTLAPLSNEIPVRHWMTDRHHLLPHLPEDLSHPPRGLALATAGTNSADGYNRLFRLEHRRLSPHQSEVGTSSENLLPPLHQILMGDIGIREDYLIDLLPFDEIDKLILRIDGNTIGVQLTREFSGVFSARDIWYLGSGLPAAPIIITRILSAIFLTSLLFSR